jgi:hypothetical protein
MVGERGVSLFLKIHTGSGGRIQPDNGNRGLFLGVKRPGREADHSPPSSAEVKNEWSYNSAPSI